MRQTPLSCLLPEGLRVAYLAAGQEGLALLAEMEAGSARCPLRGSFSWRTHSRYSRKIHDLPWRGVAVRMEVSAAGSSATRAPARGGSSASGCPT